MANNFDKIIELANVNNMGLSNTIKRDFGIPLDFTSVQESYDAAIVYAATNTLAYVGQTVAVGAKLYIISDVANGTHTVGEGEDAKTYDNYLAEVGSKTDGDGNTIELDGQTLKLAGLAGLDNSKTYVPSLINGKLIWAEPDTSTAEGQAQEINALKTRAAALEETVNGVEESEGVEAKEGLVDKVAANAKAVTDEASAREQADKAITDTIGAVAEGKTIVKMIEEAEAAAKSAIPTNVSEFTNDAGYLTEHQDISDKADKATTLAGYGITDAYTQSEVNNLISGITHFTTQVVTEISDVTQPNVLYLIKSATIEGNDNYDEYLFIEGMGAVKIGDTTTDLTDYVTNNALTEAIKDFVTISHLNTTLAPYAKTDDVNNALADKANSADVVSNDTFNQFKTDNDNAIASARSGAVSDVEAKGYAVASEVDATYAKKGTTLAEYGITDAYTKAETVAKGDVYTKSQVDALLDEVSGGSSETAASVKRALDGYIQNIDTELYGAEVVAKWTGEDGTYSPQYSVDDSRVDIAIANAATAQTQADKGVADAAIAKGVADSALAQANTNKADIAALTKQITDRNSTVDSEIATLKSKDTTIEGDISGLKTTTNDHATTLGQHTSKIGALENKDAELAALIQGNTDRFDDYSTTAQMTTAIQTAIAGANLNTYAKVTDLEAIYKAGVDGGAATGVLAEEIARATAAEKANTDAIAALVGVDTGKTIRAIAKEEVATIVGAAPEALDTLEEVANWIANDESGAAAMANDIAVLKTTVGDAESGLVKSVADNAAAIAAIVQPKASEEITVATDGTLGLGKVSVDKLVMGENTLVLDGGSAN